MGTPLVRAAFAVIVGATIAAFFVTQLLNDEFPLVLRFASTPAAISPNGKDTHREHREIFDACAAHAPKRAAKAMEQHLRHTVEFVSRSLEEDPPVTT